MWYELASRNLRKAITETKMELPLYLRLYAYMDLAVRFLARHINIYIVM